MTKPGWRRALAAAVACCAAIGGGLGACSASGQPVSSGGPSATSSGGGGGGRGGGGAGGGSLLGDASDDGPPAADAGGLCGNQIHQVVSDAPNLYFVFDSSGSMAEMAGGGFTRYQLLQEAAVQMVESLGSLINIGAAVFPLEASPTNPCQAGGEVYPVSPGDPISPMTGPTTEGFILATTVDPFGGTPTAATLTALEPALAKLKGRTVVLLATDGGPNCDAALTCDIDQCIPNLEGSCTPPGSNCCAAGGTTGPVGCLDADASVAAVGAVWGAGIPVVVIGIPGSDTYAAVLDAMAVAGGVPQPQPAPTSYYAVQDFTELLPTFQTIASAYISCDFVLTDPPPDELHTNVYFDQTVVPQNATNGWIWKSQSEIELVGDACAALKAGKVVQVQIVSGCPTQMTT